MKSSLFSIVFFFVVANVAIAQCPTCGNGAIDVGETTANCPQDIAHDATCTSPCGQPTAAESTAGLRTSEDFTGTTTFSSAGLPAGWAFASGPTATTAGTLAAAGVDAYGAKAGLIQPNCGGSCAATNGFCIGNIANIQAVGGGGTGGKLGANFDGRANINQNLSYAVLRGQGNPTLVSPTYNVSAVQGFKIQFWMSASESSCGQTNGWGSCVGNTVFLDFSSNGGTTWTQIMQMNTSSTNSDMCTNNSTNTLWLSEGRWGRVCLTVFRTAAATGNYYSAAGAGTAASGIMVNGTYFTANFKYRIRYAQTASCTAGITATNPGRYLAIDYPVFTSGNQMIPCGISFSNMCGYGLDGNDDGVGSSTLTTNSIVYSTVKSSVNQAERGVEIFNSQNSVFANQNLTGSNFTTNFDLCNPEGGDQQCIDWQSNNNAYFAVYECIADWEAGTGGGIGGINVQYYKGTTPQSVGMSKVTAVGKTALIGWRYSANRFVSCGSTSDLNPGCNGYSFLSGSLPNQFNRGFYGLATNNTGQSWAYYGATSCSHYFRGPNFSPIAVPNEVNVGSNFLVCDPPDLFFEADVDFCSTSTGFTGSASATVTGPGGFSETISAGNVGTTAITTPGDYTITASVPTTPTKCLDCGRSVCVTVTQADIDNCIALPVVLEKLTGAFVDDHVQLDWSTQSEQHSAHFEIQRSETGENFLPIGIEPAAGNSDSKKFYQFTDLAPLPLTSYYRLKMVDTDGKSKISNVIAVHPNSKTIQVIPNPSNGRFEIIHLQGLSAIQLADLQGTVIFESQTNKSSYQIDQIIESGIYILKVDSQLGSQMVRLIIE